MRKAKHILQVELEGLIGKFLANESQYLRERIDQLEDKIKSQDDLLKELVSNTKYPMKIYTEEDFTNLFHIKIRTQQHYRAMGKLDYFKSGDTVLYTQKHVDKYIEDNDCKSIRIRLKSASN